MPRRYLHRKTNVEDLLDDGIENNSDLANLVLSSETSANVNPEAAEIRERTIAKIRAQEAHAHQQQRRKGISLMGMLLGLALTCAGTLMLFRPVEMRVEHTRIRYLPTVFEHVTVGRARFYGASVLFIGVGVLGYALRKPPQ